jgi:hypothetical protein
MESARQAYFRGDQQPEFMRPTSAVSKKSNSITPEEAINRFRGNYSTLKFNVLCSCDKDKAAVTDRGVGEERTYLMFKARVQR